MKAGKAGLIRAGHDRRPFQSASSLMNHSYIFMHQKHKNIQKLNLAENVNRKEVLSYMADPIFDRAIINSKGQITLPKELMEILKVSIGSMITFVYEEDQVLIVNPKIYAINRIQKAMEGEFEKAGLTSEEDIIELCREVRKEVEGL